MRHHALILVFVRGFLKSGVGPAGRRQGKSKETAGWLEKVGAGELHTGVSGFFVWFLVQLHDLYISETHL